MLPDTSDTHWPNGNNSATGHESVSITRAAWGKSGVAAAGDADSAGLAPTPTSSKFEWQGGPMGDREDAKQTRIQPVLCNPAAIPLIVDPSA